jgi:hypothetical protein
LEATEQVNVGQSLGQSGKADTSENQKISEQDEIQEPKVLHQPNKGTTEPDTDGFVAAPDVLVD